MKIQISPERITHCQALCHDCGWCEADHIDREWLRQEVHKHVRKTGHRVSIEKGTSTLYSAAQPSAHLTLVDSAPLQALSTSEHLPIAKADSTPPTRR